MGTAARETLGPSILSKRGNQGKLEDLEKSASVLAGRCTSRGETRLMRRTKLTTVEGELTAVVVPFAAFVAVTTHVPGLLEPRADPRTLHRAVPSCK